MTAQSRYCSRFVTRQVFSVFGAEDGEKAVQPGADHLVVIVLRTQPVSQPVTSPTHSLVNLATRRSASGFRDFLGVVWSCLVQ